MKGFTLIELLVVVVIIASLSAMAMPKYMRALESSKAAEAWRTLRQKSSAADAHYAATGNILTIRDSATADWEYGTDNPGGSTLAFKAKRKKGDYAGFVARLHRRSGSWCWSAEGIPATGSLKDIAFPDSKCCVSGCSLP